jgi:ribonuclease BN (tRNA processing enzyme)
MKKVISTIWTQGIILGAGFMQEKRDGVFIGVAEVEDTSAFINADGSVKYGFEIEGYEKPEEAKPETLAPTVIKFKKVASGEVIEFDASDVELIAEADKDPELERVQE